MTPMKAVRAPATMGNFGPGFDVFSLALHDLGDGVELVEAPEDRIVLRGPHVGDVPTVWQRNVAGATVDALRQATGDEHPYEIRLTKNLPPGSGLGSSASSAGGAALAYHAMHRRSGLTPEQLVLAAGEGEAAAAGRHYDDVGAVIQGGLSVVREEEGRVRLARAQPPRNLHIAVLLASLNLPTKEMRRLLPTTVPRGVAVRQMADASQLIDAFHRGDVAAIGAAMEDGIATPKRKTRIPHFDDARTAALDAGGLGFAISGSGPAVFAVCDSRRLATSVGEAMLGAAERHNLPARSIVAKPEARVMHREV